MLVRRFVVFVGLFGRAIVRALSPIHSVSVSLLCSSGKDTNLLLMIRPTFETLEFNFVRTHGECVFKESCYFLAIHPNIAKHLRLGVHGFQRLWCCSLLHN